VNVTQTVVIPTELLSGLVEQMTLLVEQLRNLHMDLSEGVKELKEIKALLVEAKAELTGKINELQDKVAVLEEAMSHIDVPPQEAVDALNDVKGVAQEMADIIKTVPDPAVPDPEQPAA
jgi:predicted nuclease with TOPRIM domain